jgi:hypothetical protein
MENAGTVNFSAALIIAFTLIMQCECCYNQRTLSKSLSVLVITRREP